MKILNFVLLSSLFFSSTSFAGEFTPYIFKDNDLLKRADLKEFSYSLKNKKVSTIDVEAMDSTKSSLFFFHNVALFLKGLETGVDRSVKAEFRWPNCDEFQLKNKPLTTKYLQDFCKSEHILQDIKIDKEYDLNDLDTLLGTIKLLSAPARAIENLPLFVKQPNFVSKSRLVLSKLNMENVNRLFFEITTMLEADSKNASDIDKKEIKNVSDKVHDLHQKITRSYALSVVESSMTSRDYSHPFLNRSERQFISKYIGALSWRVRGGGLWEKFDGTQSLRVHFGGKVFSNLMRMHGAPQKLANDFADKMKRRLQYKGWSDWFDMGTSPGGDIFYDLMHMTKRGVYQIGIGSYKGVLDTIIAPASAVDSYDDFHFNSTALKMAGAQMGACYFYSKENMNKFRVGETLEYPLSRFIHNHTSMGEVCFGAVLGTSFQYDLDPATH